MTNDTLVFGMRWVVPACAVKLADVLAIGPAVWEDSRHA
jgi:hypothetical protein